MKARFSGDSAHPAREIEWEGPNKATDQTATVETVVLWACSGEPLVRVDFHRGRRGFRLFTTSDEAKALGLRLIEEADKIRMEEDRIGYTKQYSHGKPETRDL